MTEENILGVLKGSVRQLEEDIQKATEHHAYSKNNSSKRTVRYPCSQSELRNDLSVQTKHFVVVFHRPSPNSFFSTTANLDLDDGEQCSSYLVRASARAHPRPRYAIRSRGASCWRNPRKRRRPSRRLRACRNHVRHRQRHRLPPRSSNPKPVSRLTGYR